MALEWGSVLSLKDLTSSSQLPLWSIFFDGSLASSILFWMVPLFFALWPVSSAGGNEAITQSWRQQGGSLVIWQFVFHGWSHLSSLVARIVDFFSFFEYLLNITSFICILWMNPYNSPLSWVFYSHIFLVKRSGLMEDKWFGQGVIPSKWHS